MNKNKWVLLFILVILVGIVYAANFTGIDGALGITQQTNSTNWVFLDHTTANNLNIASSLTTIGDIAISGIRYERLLFDGAGADQFVPTANDTDRGVAQSGDKIVDSLWVSSNDFGAGDTLIITTYLTTTIATVLSVDTVIAQGTVDLTDIAAATREADLSAGERYSYFVDERGTITNFTLEEFSRSWDARN